MQLTRHNILFCNINRLLFRSMPDIRMKNAYAKQTPAPRTLIKKKKTIIDAIQGAARELVGLRQFDVSHWGCRQMAVPQMAR